MQFIRYYRQAQKIKNDENSKIIQKFIKEKLRRYFDKRDLIKKGAKETIKNKYGKTPWQCITSHF